MKSTRRSDLLKILRTGNATSQEEIADRLRSAGHDVTQATVSRDLRTVGAVKVRVGDRHLYKLADDVAGGGHGELVERNLARTLAEFTVDIRVAGSLVVLVTLPGHASAVARAIDLALLDDVVGTIAGDDTIFLATGSNAAASRLQSALDEMTTKQEAS